MSAGLLQNVCLRGRGGGGSNSVIFILVCLFNGDQLLNKVFALFWKGFPNSNKEGKHGGALYILPPSETQQCVLTIALLLPSVGPNIN